MFIFGIICSFLDIRGWIIFACIAIPYNFWVSQSIKRLLNNIIDNFVEKIVNKLKNSSDILDESS